MSEWTLLLLACLALVCAFVLGWRMSRGKESNVSGLSQDYFVGLNYLLSDKPDKAIETFVQALDLGSSSPETFDARITLGRLYARRGDVERSIRIHQGVLASPSISALQTQRVKLELARDYLLAGLMDRAEALLVDLLKHDSELKEEILEELHAIYEKQKEWLRCIEVASALTTCGRSEFTKLIAHYNCELAEQAKQDQQLKAQRVFIAEAFKSDPQCVRASFLLADLEYASGNYSECVKALQQVYHQDPAFISETLDLLLLADSKRRSFRSIAPYLEKCALIQPSSNLLRAMAHVIQARSGVGMAYEYVLEQLSLRPSLKGLNVLVQMQSEEMDSTSHDGLREVAPLLGRILDDKHRFRCGSCGFSVRQLLWHCPSCKTWGGFKPIRGVPKA